MKKATEINDLLEYILDNGGVFDENNHLHLPDSLGKGYFRIIRPLKQLSVMLQNFELKESISIKRNKQSLTNEKIIFSFRNLLNSIRKESDTPAGLLPTVLVSSSDIELNIDVPKSLNSYNILIVIDTDYLRQQLERDNNLSLIELITKQEQSYLYEEVITSKIQLVAAEMFNQPPTSNLKNFHYRVKAEELVCLFLETLTQREEITEYPFHKKDIKEVYTLRDEILLDLSNPPTLDVLAAKANMSVSKLGKIFKQIFGDSIYNYYQRIRMQQAALLLENKNMSVSEVGHHLGFTNLSHFSRLFEKHIGITPKKYSRNFVDKSEHF